MLDTRGPAASGVETGYIVFLGVVAASPLSPLSPVARLALFCSIKGCPAPGVAVFAWTLPRVLRSLQGGGGLASRAEQNSSCLRASAAYEYVRKTAWIKAKESRRNA